MMIPQSHRGWWVGWDGGGWADQILAAVREAGGFPLSTSQVAKAVNIRAAQLPADGIWWVWDQLEKLEAQGLVVRERDLSELTGLRCAYWLAYQGSVRHG